MTIEDVYLKNNVQLIDDRGEFFKFLDGNESFLSKTFGEIYLVTVLPNKVRAEHYHNIANEWFAVLKGELIITLEDVISKVKISYTLNSINKSILFIPSGIAHKIYNPSLETESILVAYSNIKYDSNDTIPYIIK